MALTFFLPAYTQKRKKNAAVSFEFRTGSFLVFCVIPVSLAL